MQNILFYVLEGEMFVQMLNLRYFTMLCNNNRMDQDLNPGQESWSVVRCTEQNKDLYKALVGPTNLLQH
jgi:hypothetical protein